MINTTGKLLSEIINETVFLRTCPSGRFRKTSEEKLKTLRVTALNYPSLLRAAEKGVISGNYLINYNLNQGFVVSEEIPNSIILSDELTSADQTKLNKGE